MKIILIVIILCILIVLLIKFHKLKKLFKKLEELYEQRKKLNQILINKIQELNKNLLVIKDTIKSSQSLIKYINNTINEKQLEHKKILKQIEDLKKESNNFYNQLKKIVLKQLEDFKKISEKAAENYFDNLLKAYKDADAAHAKKMTKLKEELDSAAADLNNLKETRKAAYEAILRLNEIKLNKDNYCLKPTEVDLYDINSLKQLSKTFHKPRVISMLIWQYYFQPLAKKQFPIILKGSTKTGVYKITNLLTNLSYIGQSVDIYKRWTDHCKAGLGIDTPAGNKLYQKMRSDGLLNFTFELLCECSKEELDEKERYFIDLYQSNLFGYNITKGNK